MNDMGTFKGEKMLLKKRKVAQIKIQIYDVINIQICSN